ncbi:MAG: hypothetical protein ACR2P5_07930 [Gammaproteobacteria bacterium]
MGCIPAASRRLSPFAAELDANRKPPNPAPAAVIPSPPSFLRRQESFTYSAIPQEIPAYAGMTKKAGEKIAARVKKCRFCVLIKIDNAEIQATPLPGVPLNTIPPGNGRRYHDSLLMHYQRPALAPDF